MKCEGSGSKGTRVIERKQSVTDGQTVRRTGQKQYDSPGGGGDITTTNTFISVQHCTILFTESKCKATKK